MKYGKTRGLLLLFYRMCIFFLSVGFALTCNISLFLNLLSRYVEIEFTEENIRIAAMFTFYNAIFLTLIYTLIDHIRRKIMVERPVGRILEATEKIKNGDLSVRIKPAKMPVGMNDFNPVIKDLNVMIDELSGMETLRTDFISNVSHELKTPLAALQNYGTLIQNPELSDEERNDYARSIVSTTQRLSELVTNILRLNKLENQSIYPNTARCCLSEQICECLLMFESRWEQKNIDIQTDIEEDIYFSTDAELLALIWNNLFSNAIKFTPEGGTVSVRLKEKDGFICVEVEDTGCGMTAETGKHIFEKFYQGDTSHSTEGNGLGLALVKRTVDILGGEISVESRLNEGTKFTVKFKKQ